MATDQKPNSFYDQVDRYRYRNNWGCLAWALVVLLIVIAIGLWFLTHRS